MNPSNPKYSEWYSLCLDLDHTIQVCGGERVSVRNKRIIILFFQIHVNKVVFNYIYHCLSDISIYGSTFKIEPSEVFSTKKIILLFQHLWQNETMPLGKNNQRTYI